MTSYFFQILTGAKEYTTSKRNGCVKLRKEDSGLGSEEPISVPTLLQDAAAAYPDVSHHLFKDHFFSYFKLFICFTKWSRVSKLTKNVKQISLVLMWQIRFNPPDFRPPFFVDFFNFLKKYTWYKGLHFDSWRTEVWHYQEQNSKVEINLSRWLQISAWHSLSILIS